MANWKRATRIAVWFVVAFSAGPLAAQQAPKPEPDWTKHNRIITVKGCLASPVANQFTLTAGGTPTAGVYTDPTLPPATSTTLLIYILLPNGKKLGEYLNQHVEVRGRIDGVNDMVLEIRGPGPAAAPSVEPTVTDAQPRPDTEARLSVLKVKRLATTCV